MRTLVISDVHLTDKFEQVKYEKLVQVITSCDLVIINGDFWEAYFLSFDEFLASKWSKLFPLLRERNAVYLFGNHDPGKFCDKEKAKVFSVFQGQEYDQDFGELKIHFEHGDKAGTTPDGKYPGLFANKLGMLFGDLISRIMIKISPEVYFKSKEKDDRGLCEYSKKLHDRNGRIQILSHSHLQRKHHDVPMVNTGLFKYGFAQYLVIEDGKITLHDERY